MKPIIVVTTAAYSSERARACARLLSELRPQCESADVELFTHYDSAGKGSLGPWLHALKYAVTRTDASHVTYLPDDAILVPHFVEVLIACIKAHPETIMCFQSNHLSSPKAARDGARWYTTPEGYTAFGGTMPREWVVEHLAWRERHVRTDVLTQNDEGVNLWAMATGRQIYKSLPSLVDHDLSLESQDGNDWHFGKSPRRPLVWDAKADLRNVDWSGPVVHLGRTYSNNHWRLMTRLRTPMTRLAYQIDRDEPR